jgi:hypothetical protein
MQCFMILMRCKIQIYRKTKSISKNLCIFNSIFNSLFKFAKIFSFVWSYEFQETLYFFLFKS